MLHYHTAKCIKKIIFEHLQLRLPIGEKWPKHKCIHYIRENMMEIFVEHLLNLFHWVHNNFLFIFYFTVCHKDIEGSTNMQHKLKRKKYHTAPSVFIGTRK